MSRFASPLAAVLLLGITQVLGYGTLFYSYSILAADIAGGFGWSVSWAYAAFSGALLIGGLTTPIVGRWFDRAGAPVVMAGGSAVSAVALAIMAAAPNAWVFLAGLVLSQLAANTVLYEAAFTTLVQVTRGQAGRAITHLTLIAGFASTLFWPFTQWLHGHWGWREIYGGFALVNLLVCLPLHTLLHWARRPGIPEGAAATRTVAPAHEPLPEALQRRAMILVTIGFALGNVALTAILTQMVPLLGALGLSASAVAVGALFGPSQVAIRFLNMALAGSHHPIRPTLVSAAAIPVAIVILVVTMPWVPGAIAFAMLLGFGSGLKSIVQGTLPLALFGQAAYGERLGRIASVRVVLTALSPVTLAALIEAWGPVVALAIMAAIGLAGLACLAGVARLRQSR